MAHGYYNLAGKFVTTTTKAAATAAWREERGYDPIGVFDMGGGEVVDTRQVSRQRETAPAPTPAANLAQTLTGETAVERNARLQATFDAASSAPAGSTYDVQGIQSLAASRFVSPTTTPTATSTWLATSGYGAPGLSYEEKASAGTGENVVTGGGSYQYQQAPPAPATAEPYSPLSVIGKALSTTGRAVADTLGITQPTTTATSIPEASQVGRWLGADQQTEYEQWLKEKEPSQYTGRQYYMGGSEQAYLGPVAQAEEYFFGTGDKWGLGSSYIDIAPEDRKPPPILNQSTVRILTKSGPSYLEGVDYGPSMTMQDIERIYEFDPVTGHYLLKGAAEPALDYGYPGYYTSSGQGYASAGPGYGQGYGYGSRGGQVGGGLVSWRIGF